MKLENFQLLVTWLLFVTLCGSIAVGSVLATTADAVCFGWNFPFALATIMARIATKERCAE